MQALFASVVVAVLTGLTVLAARHPDGYSRLFISIMTPLVIVTAAALVWNIAVITAFYTVTPFVEAGQHSDAKASVEAMRVPQMWIWVALGCSAYLLFLTNLRKFLTGRVKKEG